MKSLFTITVAVLIIAIGCTKPKQNIIQPEVYTKQEIDLKLDSLKQNILNTVAISIDAVDSASQAGVQANREELRNYRKNTTATKIPDTVLFCNQRIPLERHDVRQRFEKEMYVLIDDQAQLILYQLRSILFFPIIDSLLLEGGMPLDLKYIAVIESALKPKARSRAKAQGFWQFMYWTADKYGIDRNSYVDMRNNLIASTTGAIAYFNKLYEQFDDWFLALAGYNMGENGLAADIKEQGTNDYFELVLPPETENYIFRAAAVKQILEDPDRYGIPLEEIIPWESPPSDTVFVTVRHRLKVRWVADWCQTTYRQIVLFNPEVKGDMWGPGKYIIRVPAGTREMFYQGLKDIKSGEYKEP